MNSPSRFTVALIQMGMSADLNENLEKGAAFAGRAARDGADVICLPEMFRSLYFCQTENEECFDVAEPIPGPSTERLGEVAREHGVTIIAPIFERRALGLYHNSLAVIDERGEIAGIYRKMHIPDDPGYYEKYYFAPGDLGFRAFDTPRGKIGTLICWDQWFPEAARLTAMQGAAVLFYPTAIGWLPGEKEGAGAAQHDAWRTMQRSHAIANGVYVAAVNRVGVEKPTGGAGIEFWGRSFLCDPFGHVIAAAHGENEEIIKGEIDLGLVESTRRTWPFLRDRRVDAYGGLVERFLEKTK